MPKLIGQNTEMTERINVAATPELRHLVERAVAQRDATLSHWVRRVLEKAAKEQLGEMA